jgi:hypothetical protein
MLMPAVILTLKRSIQLSCAHATNLRPSMLTRSCADVHNGCFCLMCCCVVLRVSADGSGDRGSQGSRYPQGYTRRRRRGAAAATCQRQQGGARHTASVGRLGIVDGPDDQPSVQAGAHDVIYPACSRQYSIAAHRIAPLLLPATLLPQYYIGHTPTYRTILVLYDQPALTSECVCCSVCACHLLPWTWTWTWRARACHLHAVQRLPPHKLQRAGQRWLRITYHALPRLYVGPAVRSNRGNLHAANRA